MGETIKHNTFVYIAHEQATKYTKTQKRSRAVLNTMMASFLGYNNRFIQIEEQSETYN